MSEWNRGCHSGIPMTEMAGAGAGAAEAAEAEHNCIVPKPFLYEDR